MKKGIGKTREWKAKVEALETENEELKKQVQLLNTKVRILERSCACYVNNLKYGKVE